MISLDTNILVRLLVEDDEDQAATARDLLRRSIEAGEPCLVTVVAICELQWVLKRLYKVSREDRASAIEDLLLDDRYLIEESVTVGAAVVRFRNGKADLADYLIGLKSRSLGAEETATFDRALRGEDGFRVL
ncbi:MAG: type II toxin-antitoxin system VapC family toxin [bacterium]|nr:type II toxin-antitoxin system VapC family toxin [bacterium]